MRAVYETSSRPCRVAGLFLDCSGGYGLRFATPVPPADFRLTLPGQKSSMLLQESQGKLPISELLNFKGQFRGGWEASQGDGASKYCAGV
jgi:hypothetical protein